MARTRGITVSANQDLITEECCCGVLFAMAKEFHDQCRARAALSKAKEIDQ